MTMTMENNVLFGATFAPGTKQEHFNFVPSQSCMAVLPSHPPSITHNPTPPLLTHNLIMSTKQQVNGTIHNHVTTVTSPSQHNSSPPTQTNKEIVKKLQIVETPSFESKINDFIQETSGEETLEAETSETESKFSSDEEDNDESSCSTPPEDYVEHVEGYEMVSFETIVVPPPPPDDGDNSEDKNEKITELHEDTPRYAEAQVVVKITEEQARVCLLEHVESHVCYGRETAKQMVITGMEYVPALHYELQTFTERRETCWSYAPHRPENKSHVDGPETCDDPAPLPWQLEQLPVKMFRDEVRLVTVPHTGVVKTCHKCRGNGGMTCGECYGKGWMRCLHCHGGEALSDGHSLARDRCYYCQHSKYGHGRMECEKCQARGKVNCSTCEGTTHIRSHIQLSVSWRLVTSEHISTKLNIPENLIRNVSGQVAFEEEFPKVEPVTAFKEETIKMASAQLVSSHATKFPEEKILRQRHQVRVVPVTKVNYEWKGKTRCFFVYGYENKVYLPSRSYPQAYCWGCNIM